MASSPLLQTLPVSRGHRDCRRAANPHAHARSRTHTCAHAAHAVFGLCGAAQAPQAGWDEARDIVSVVVRSPGSGDVSEGFDDPYY